MVMVVVVVVVVVMVREVGGDLYPPTANICRDCCPSSFVVIRTVDELWEKELTSIFEWLQ